MRSLTPSRPVSMPYYSDLLAFVDSNGKIGYLNTSGKEVIPAQFDRVASLFSTFRDDGYAVVRLGDRYGVIDKTGKYIINPQFDGLIINANLIDG